MKKYTNITLSDIKKRCERKNANANNKLHWFSSRFSIYFSYLFIKLKLSADQVTIVFFLIGLFGAVFFSFNSIFFSIVGYVLFRLHIIIDMSDGDVARYYESFSIRGAYWDAVIHSIVNPAYYILISYSFFLQFDNYFFLIFSSFIGLSSSILMSVKNNFFKAMFFNKKQTEEKKSGNVNLRGWKFKVLFVVSEVLSIEGFVLLTVIVRIINLELFASILVSSYLIFNLLISFIKFYQLSYTGKTFSKS